MTGLYSMLRALTGVRPTMLSLQAAVQAKPSSAYTHIQDAALWQPRHGPVGEMAALAWPSNVFASRTFLATVKAEKMLPEMRRAPGFMVFEDNGFVALVSEREAQQVREALRAEGEQRRGLALVHIAFARAVLPLAGGDAPAPLLFHGHWEPGVGKVGRADGATAGDAVVAVQLVAGDVTYRGLPGSTRERDAARMAALEALLRDPQRRGRALSNGGPRAAVTKLLQARDRERLLPGSDLDEACIRVAAAMRVPAHTLPRVEEHSDESAEPPRSRDPTRAPARPGRPPTKRMAAQRQRPPRGRGPGRRAKRPAARRAGPPRSREERSVYKTKHDGDAELLSATQMTSSAPSVNAGLLPPPSLSAAPPPPERRELSSRKLPVDTVRG